MFKKKIILTISIVLILVASFSVYHLSKPEPKAEALPFIDIWDIFCDSCKGQYTDCCEKQCYEETLRGTSTDGFDHTAWQLCVDNCVTFLKYMCFGY